MRTTRHETTRFYDGERKRSRWQALAQNVAGERVEWGEHAPTRREAKQQALSVCAAHTLTLISLRRT